MKLFGDPHGTEVGSLDESSSQRKETNIPGTNVPIGLDMCGGALRFALGRPAEGHPTLDWVRSPCRLQYFSSRSLAEPANSVRLLQTSSISSLSMWLKNGKAMARDAIWSVT